MPDTEELPEPLTIWNCWLCWPGLCQLRNDSEHMAQRAAQLESQDGSAQA
jgi:hypothetical protein